MAKTGQLRWAERLWAKPCICRACPVLQGANHLVSSPSSSAPLRLQRRKDRDRTAGAAAHLTLHAPAFAGIIAQLVAVAKHL